MITDIKIMKEIINPKDFLHSFHHLLQCMRIISLSYIIQQPKIIIIKDEFIL
jgi:hypothetical protein